MNIGTFNTEKLPLKKIYSYVKENFKFAPANIIKELDLLKPIYKNTACNEHFGKNEFSWKKIIQFKHI